MDAEARRAIVLLSGGLDSTTVLAIAKSRGFAVHALTFDYGQRHSRELEAARQVASAGGVSEHVFVKFDLRRFGGSSLTTGEPVPHRDVASIQDTGVPSTYVPARNTIFLSFALAWAEVLPSWDIFIGVNSVDYSGYPDCRPEFISAFQQLANLATRAGVSEGPRITIHAPLSSLNKAEIIREGLRLGVDYALTTSCYDPANDVACGHCDACILRRRGFAEAGVTDPVPYAL